MEEAQVHKYIVHKYTNMVQHMYKYKYTSIQIQYRNIVLSTGWGRVCTVKEELQI